MLPALLGAAAAPIIAGVLGGQKAGQFGKEAERQLDSARAGYDAIDLPDIADLQYQANQQDYAGDIDPALMGNVSDISSAFDQVSADPRFQQAQYQSLGSLQNIADNGGMTLADKVAADGAMRDAAMQNSRQQGSITRDMAERGLGGGGQELAMRLAAQQNAANLNSQASQNMAANAQQRALQAIMQQGSLATGMQNSAYTQQDAAAQAQDAIRRFNQTNAINNQQTNMQAMNQAAESNRNAKQGVLGANQQANNAASQFNAQAPLASANAELNKASGVAGVAANQSQARIDRGDQIANQYAAAGKGVGSIFGSFK